MVAMTPSATPYRISDKANAGPFVHETEALEFVKREQDGRAHNHWLMAEAAAYEAESLLNLLARWKGKR
jgi:hypothetical protein